MKYVYVLLLRSHTMASRMIGFASHSQYTHASIGFEENSSQFKLYSFSRYYRYSPYPAGFVEENINKGVMKMNPNAPCILYRIPVSDECYRAMKREMWEQEHAEKDSRYTYNYLGIIYNYFGIAKKREKKRFCSEFVAELLQRYQLLSDQKSPSLYRPDDFLKNPSWEICYTGNLGDMRHSYSM